MGVRATIGAHVLFSGRWSAIPRAADRLELLEQGIGSPEEIARSLSEMDRCNRWLGGRAALGSVLWPKLERLPKSRPVRILDAGSGGGYLLDWLQCEMERRGYRARLYGLDFDRRYVVEAARRASEASLVAGDVCSPPFVAGAFDFVVSTLVLHHLEPPELEAAIRRLDCLAEHGLVLNDLVRDGVPLAFFRLTGRLMLLSEITRKDGQTSICRSYTPEEIRSYLNQWDLAGEVREHWPAYRLTVVTRSADR